MKKAFFLSLASAFLLLACNNDKKITHTEKHEDGTVTTTSFNVDNIEDQADEMSSRMEKLKTLTPLTLDELKALLPGELSGVPRSNFNANSTMGFAMAESEYQKDDTTEYKISIYDCAGEAGSGIYGLSYWAKMNMQQESSDGYTKTIDFQGDKAVESYKKDDNESSLTYVVGERLLVVLTGRNIGMDQLKGIAKDLKLKI